MRLLSKHGYQYIRLEIVCQQANYEPEYEEIYHHFSFPSISQRMSWPVKYAFLFWRKSFSALSSFVRRWIIMPWPQSSVTHLQNELFVYILGDVGQMVPAPPASSRKGVFSCRPLTEKGSKISWFGSWGRGHFAVQNICLFIPWA